MSKDRDSKGDSLEESAGKLIEQFESKMRGDLVSCYYCWEWIPLNAEHCEEWGILPCPEENETGVHHCDPYLLDHEVCFFCGSWGEAGEEIDIEESTGLPEARDSQIPIGMHLSNERVERDLVSRRVWECDECKSDFA